MLYNGLSASSTHTVLHVFTYTRLSRELSHNQFYTSKTTMHLFILFRDIKSGGGGGRVVSQLNGFDDVALDRTL